MLDDFFTGSPAEAIGWGGLVIGVLRYFLLKRKASSSDMRFMVERLEKQNSEKSKQIAQLTARVESLTVRLEILQNAKYESSLPFWIKSKSGRLIYGNNAYRNLFLLPNGFDYNEVLDKTDAEIWPDKSLAELYRQNDLQVIQSGNGKRFEGVMMQAGESVDYICYIDPYFVRGSIAGVVGVAVPAE